MKVIGITVTVRNCRNYQPFTHLTPISRYTIKEKLILKKNNAILLTDHLHKDLLQITDTLFFIKDGFSRIIEDQKDLEESGYLGLWDISFVIETKSQQEPHSQNIHESIQKIKFSKIKVICVVKEKIRQNKSEG